MRQRLLAMLALVAGCSAGQAQPAIDGVDGVSDALASTMHDVAGRVGSWNVPAQAGEPAGGDGTVTGPPVTGGGSPGDTDTTPPATSACKPLELERDVAVGGFRSDRYTWFDQDCRARTAAMVRNTQQDPEGFYGGYARQFTYDLGGSIRTCAPSVSGHPGFGYTVNHTGSPSVSSRRTPGTTTVVLAGRHHAIHEYRWTYAISGQPVTVTVDWFFATGRSSPLWAVTYDTSAAPPDSISADTRGPYGDIDWDGTGGDVEGVGWGDRYKFRSLASPVTFDSGWDYTEPNTVPYAMEWSNQADAEMGLVQTQTYLQHDGGGYGNWVNWGKRSETGPMPVDYNWTYQLNQYSIPYTTASHRLAWGTNLGAVGQRAYPVYGNDATASGYPYQSYSVYIVLGRHGEEPVAATVDQVETVQRTTLTATVGSVVTSGPAGVGRTDQVTYAPAGYDHVYGTWELVADNGAVDAQLDVASGALTDPVLVVHGWTGGDPASIRLGDRSLRADVEYFASVDAATRTLWVTLPGSFGGTSRIRIQ